MERSAGHPDSKSIEYIIDKTAALIREDIYIDDLCIDMNYDNQQFMCSILLLFIEFYNYGLPSQFMIDMSNKVGQRGADECDICAETFYPHRERSTAAILSIYERIMRFYGEMSLVPDDICKDAAHDVCVAFPLFVKTFHALYTDYGHKEGDENKLRRLGALYIGVARQQLRNARDYMAVD